MLNRLRTYVSLSARDKLLVCEAIAMLSWGWFVVRVLGVRRYSSHLGTQLPGEYYDTTPQDETRLRKVRWSITVSNRLFFGKFNCLMLGIAGKAMLNRRGVSNTLVLGTRLTREGAEDGPNTFKAHAWLWAGQKIMLGGEVRSEYVPITSYHSG